MNLLSLRLDPKHKVKLRRVWWHLQDDGMLLLWLVAGLLTGTLVFIAFDKALGAFR